MKIRRRSHLLPVLLLALAAGPAAAQGIPIGGPVPNAGEPGGPGRVLDAQELARFTRGRLLFDTPMHRSNGLGAPEMNGDSCRACHQDPVVGGAGGLELNVSRFGLDNGGAGPFTNLSGGQIASKLYPPFTVGREEHPTNADVFEQRQSPALFGAGLIEALPDAVILANEDPLDANGDGIFGVARLVDVGGGVLEIGRFGWKAGVPKLVDFVRDAMGNELGITTPDGGRGFAVLTDSDAVPDPELGEDEVQDIAFFMRELGPLRRRANDSARVPVGEALFEQVGCATCHVPTLQGPSGPVNLYSNLLLHDVMPDGFRGMADPGAGVGLYRTAPLWGVRFTPPYMHDGRAETLEDAIASHAGEAENVRQAYDALSPDDRRAVLRFLRSL